MARQKETAENDDLEQQYPETRLTRIDTVRRQGERQLRKVCYLICSNANQCIEIFRCVNKFSLVLH